MNTIKIKEPSVCPFCGSPVKRLIDNGAHLYCTNPDCSERVLAKLTYFVTKECMNIDGLSEKTLRKLVSNLNLHDWWDLYVLSPADFINGGCGEKTAQKIYDELCKSRIDTPAENVLMALGIPMVGKVTAKKLLETYNSIKGIEDCVSSNGNDIKELIGEVAGQSVIDYFCNERNVINHVYVYLPYEYNNKAVHSSDKLSGLTILATGTLQNFSRDGIKDSVISNGGIYASGISKKLDYLIVGDNAGPSKLDKAKSLNLKMITESEYLNLIK